MKTHTPATYRTMPWANGRGQTTELLREDGPDGLTLRLSIAVVAEDGAFSLLPGIDRTLTVISGPGFWLRGDGVAVHAAPLLPITFSGDLAVTATDVTAPSEDFNVMTARAAPRPQVWLAHPGVIIAHLRLFLLTLGPCNVDGHPVPARYLVETTHAARLQSGNALAVSFG